MFTCEDDGPFALSLLSVCALDSSNHGLSRRDTGGFCEDSWLESADRDGVGIVVRISRCLGAITILR